MDELDDTSEDDKDNEGSLTTPNKVHQKVKLGKVDCCSAVICFSLESSCKGSYCC